MKNVLFLSAEAFPRMEYPPTPLIKKEEDIHDKNLHKIKIRLTPNIAAFDTY